MKSMPLSEIEDSIKRFEKKLGRSYDIRIHNPDNVQPGKALYCANHFHYFDPTFLMYAVAKSKKVLAHQMAKPSLYKIPMIAKELRKHKAIMTPRPKKGEKLTKVDYKRMKKEISDYLEIDEPISFAYSGTRTENYGLDEGSKNKEIKASNTGVLTLTQGQSGLRIIPVAIDTYQKNTKKVYARAFIAKLGLLRLFTPKQKIGVDISFGVPIDIDSYLSSHTKKDLMSKVVEEVYHMRIKHFEMNKGDPIRSLSKYY